MKTSDKSKPMCPLCKQFGFVVNAMPDAEEEFFCNQCAHWFDRPEPGQAKMVRTFATGATRDTDDNKLDYEGFLSPLVLERYAEYMHIHRKQSDGRLRSSDNWQKGMPRNAYMKSMWRHFHDVWKGHREGQAQISVTLEEALCALMFNVMGMLHEILKGRNRDGS